MRIYLFLNLKSKTNLGGTLDENPLGEELVKPVYKFAKSVTKTSIKVSKPTTYDEAINNLIHKYKCHKVIDKKLWNLDTH